MLRALTPNNPTKKLTSLEMALLESAVKGNDEVFDKLLSAIKRSYGGTIPSEKVKQIFEEGIPEGASVLQKIIGDYPTNETPINSSTAKIILSLLDELEKANYDTQLALPFFHTSISAWAGKYGFDTVLAHPLVQKEMIIRQIQDHFLSGDIELARNIYANLREEYKLTHQSVFKFLGIRIKDSNLDIVVKDRILAELLQGKDIDIHEFLYNAQEQNIVRNIIAAKFTSVQKTQVFKMHEAIYNLSLENPPNQHQPKAIKLIESYFGKMEPKRKSEEASLTLKHLLTSEDFIGIARPIMAQDTKRAICTALIKQGAKIEIPPCTITLLPPQIMFDCLELDAGTNEICKAFTFSPELSKMDYRSILVNTFGRVEKVIPETQAIAYLPNQAALKALCKNARPCFTVDYFLGIDPLTGFFHPHPAEDDEDYQKKKLEADEKDKAIQTIFENGLVEDMDSIKPGAYQLHFNDPKTDAPYDLYQYFEDNPNFKKALLTAQRDQELVGEYLLALATLRSDSRSKDELEILDEEIGPILHGGHEHSLAKIKEFMHKYPDIAPHIIGHMSDVEKPTKQAEGSTIFNTAQSFEKQRKDSAAKSFNVVEKVEEVTTGVTRTHKHKK